MYYTQHFDYSNYSITTYLPDQPHMHSPIWLTFSDSPAEAEQLAQMLPENHILFSVLHQHWEHAFTPWHAPRLFAKGADFTGGADDTLNALTQRILPEITQKLALQPAYWGVLGYSLAGLFALYSAYRVAYFQRIACVSGSLWFDDWVDFVKNHAPVALPQAVYFSLGDAEHKSRNPRMSQVQDCTEQVFAHWQTFDVPTVLQINQGGHFDDVAQRLATAAHWLANI